MGKLRKTNIMSSRKNKSNRKRKSKRNKVQSEEPNYLVPCKQLLNQITGIDDSKPFHGAMASSNKIYAGYHRLISSPITFKTIHARLYAKPCHYKGYEAFNADVLRLFVQEKKLKNYRGSDPDLAKKRLQKVKRTENYWSSLTAPYTEYGFDAVISHQ